MKPKFKIGQKVSVIGDIENGIKPGTTGVIIDIGTCLAENGDFWQEYYLDFYPDAAWREDEVTELLES